MVHRAPCAVRCARLRFRSMPSAPPAPSSRSGRTLSEAIQRGVITADGGMGTQLHERGVRFDVNYEELVVSRPEIVRRVHEDYVRAGAQLVETSTFGGNRVRLARH